MTAYDKDAIAVLETKIHRVDGKRVCRCEDCRAIRRVCLLAREAMDERAKRSKAIGRAVKSAIRAMDQQQANDRLSAAIGAMGGAR
jgi:hypothetical protein